jgi:hypothetical protein
MSLRHRVPYGLCDRPNNMVLQVAGLHMLTIACNERHVLAFFVFETDFPASEQLRPWLNVREFWILERSFQLSADHVFETVVGDNMVMRALVFD